MPTYDYQCRACGSVTEVIHSMLEDGPTACEQCGGQLRRVLYPTGIIFKGSGFYRTDSRKPPSEGVAGGSSSTPSDPAPAPSDGTKPTEGGGGKAAAESSAG